MKNIIMVSILSVFTLVFLTGTIFSMGSKNKAKVKSGAITSQNLAPSFSVTDIYGKETITLEKYKGKTILLNFFATWCPPCKAEIPDIISLQEKNKDSLIVIGVSLDDSVDVVKPFDQNMGINYPVIMGSREMVESYGGVSAIPTTFIINSKGEITKKIVGLRNYSQFENEIKAAK